MLGYATNSHSRFWAKVGRKCAVARTPYTAKSFTAARRVWGRGYGLPGASWAQIGRRCDPVARKRSRLAFLAKRRPRDAGGRFLSLGRHITGKYKRVGGRLSSTQAKKWVKAAGMNPFGYSLGEVPVVGRYLDDATQHLSVENVKEGAGIVGGAAATYLVTKYAVPKALAAWNQGWWGVGLTTLAGGAATLAASLLLPALAVPVGLGAFLASAIRALIVGAPTLIDKAVQPLLEWKELETSAPAPAVTGAGAGYRAMGGRVAGLLAGKYARQPAFAGLEGGFEAAGSRDVF